MVERGCLSRTDGGMKERGRGASFSSQVGSTLERSRQASMMSGWNLRRRLPSLSSS